MEPNIIHLLVICPYCKEEIPSNLFTLKWDIDFDKNFTFISKEDKIALMAGFFTSLNEELKKASSYCPLCLGRPLTKT